jgi:hypothetical protein
MGLVWDARWCRRAFEPDTPLLRYPVGQFERYPDDTNLAAFEWVLWKPGARPIALRDQFRRARRVRILRHGLGPRGRLPMSTAVLFLGGGLYLLLARPAWTASTVNSDVMAACAVLVAVAATLWWRGRVPRYGLAHEYRAWNDAVQPWSLHCRHVADHDLYPDLCWLVQRLSAYAGALAEQARENSSGNREQETIHQGVWRYVAGDAPSRDAVQRAGYEIDRLTRLVHTRNTDRRQDGFES